MPLVSKSFSDIITFTRASTATYFDSAGVLQSAANDAPRFDYNPATLAAQGLLIEEQRTNSIRNNTMVGAVAGTPGTLPSISGSPVWSVATGGLTGITQQIVGTGIESGITYLDIRFFGAPSAAGTYRIYTETTTAVAALTGQTWSNSQYLKLAAGTLTGVTGFTDVYQEFTSAGAFITEAGIVIDSPTTAGLATQRSATSRTLAGGATTAFVRAGVQLTLSGVAIDITLRIGLPQLELGAFATSVIPTTTTALTRAADVASVNTLSPWFNASQGTLYAEYNIPFALTATSGPRLGTFIGSGGAGVDELSLFVLQAAGKAASANAFTSGANAGRIDASASFVANTIVKAVQAYASNDRAVTTGGSVPSTSTAAYTIPTVTTLRIGSQDSVGSNNVNGYLRRITYYPRRLSNAELQAITS